MADSVYEELMGKRTEGLDVPQVRIKDTVEQTTGRDSAYDELMGKPKDQEDDGPAIDMGGTLKKKDLYKRDNVNTLRNFMVGYRGTDYKDAKDDQVVEDFVDTMRWFNGNIVSTAGVARYVYNGDDQQKADADKAFKLYDKLGNVFVNDGFFGAVDGIRIVSVSLGVLSVFFIVRVLVEPQEYCPFALILGQRTASGLFHGLSYPRIAGTLVGLHAEPQAEWRLETMANKAGMSRTAFANHFREALNTKPGKYLSQLRLAIAQRAVASGHGLKTAARRTGYANASALSRALSKTRTQEA